MKEKQLKKKVSRGEKKSEYMSTLERNYLKLQIRDKKYQKQVFEISTVEPNCCAKTVSSKVFHLRSLTSLCKKSIIVGRNLVTKYLHRNAQAHHSKNVIFSKTLSPSTP